jgi:hypothetical protein
VDFARQKITTKKVFDKPDEEVNMCSFVNGDLFTFMTTNDDNGELNLYQIDINGHSSKKTLKYPIPGFLPKRNFKLSNLLWGLLVYSEGDEVNLAAGRSKTKLYNFPDRLVFVNNYSQSPTHVVTILLPSLQVTSQEIDHGNEVKLSNNYPYYINSCLFEKRLVTMVTQKNKVSLLIYDLPEVKFIKKLEINSDISERELLQEPLSIHIDETSTKEKKTGVKHVIAEMMNGSDAIAINRIKDYLVLTIGRYDRLNKYKTVPVTGGKEKPDVITSGVTTSHYTVRQYPFAVTYIEDHSYQVGLKIKGHYYETSFFKMALSDKTFEPVANATDNSLKLEQASHYVNERSSDLAAGFFAIDDRYYYSYYDKSSAKYVIEEMSFTQ